MPKYNFSGLNDTQCKILYDDDNSEIDIVIPGNSQFITMNALDCCKDAFEATTKVKNYKIINDTNNILFGKGDWLSSWKVNLNMNFKEYMRATNNTEEEVVFERNKISLEKLNQIFF